MLLMRAISLRQELYQVGLLSPDPACTAAARWRAAGAGGWCQKAPFARSLPPGRQVVWDPHLERGV